VQYCNLYNEVLFPRLTDSSHLAGIDLMSSDLVFLLCVQNSAAGELVKFVEFDRGSCNTIEMHVKQYGEGTTDAPAILCYISRM
jgi:hypothetical protein